MSSEVVELERAVDGEPDYWREVAVADVVAMLPGFAFKSENFVTDPDEGLPLIRIRDLSQTATVTRYVGGYDEAFAVQDGDILVGMDGEFAAVRWQGGKALLNQRVLKLSTARPEAMDEGYLFYRVQPALLELEQTISGTTVKHLSTKDLKRLTWQLPPLDEQRRIAEVLRSVDEAIAANRATIDAARRTLEALATEIATEASVTRTVADFGRVVTGGTPSPKNAELWDGKLPFVTPGDLDDECISVRSAARSLNTSAPHGAQVLPANSVLVTCIGSTVGKVAISRRECATNQQINAISCDPELAGYVYLACLAAYEDILANAGKQAVPIINKSTFSGLALPCFPRERMCEISEAVDALDDERERSVAASERLTSMKASLMSDLLSGRVRAPA